MITINTSDHESILIEDADACISVAVDTAPDKALIAVTTRSGAAEIQVLPDGSRVIHQSEPGNISLEERIESVIKSIAVDMSAALAATRKDIRGGIIDHSDSEGVENMGWLYVDDVIIAINVVLKKYGAELL
jgi:hypothetical protein